MYAPGSPVHYLRRSILKHAYSYTSLVRWWCTLNFTWFSVCAHKRQQTHTHTHSRKPERRLPNNNRWLPIMWCNLIYCSTQTHTHLWKHIVEHLKTIRQKRLSQVFWVWVFVNRRAWCFDYKRFCASELCRRRGRSGAVAGQLYSSALSPNHIVNGLECF